jgi:hypothetical protein
MRISKKLQAQIKIENRIAELRAIQRQEVENNFANSDLWDKCDDIIYCLLTFGQETYPVYQECEDPEFYVRCQY